MTWEGPPWWSRDEDYELPIPGAQVQSLVGELDPTCCNGKILHAATERSCMLQQRWKISCAATKTWCSQIKKISIKKLTWEMAFLRKLVLLVSLPHGLTGWVSVLTAWVHRCWGGVPYFQLSDLFHLPTTRRSNQSILKEISPGIS